MDILAHMLWANYGTRPINKKLESKNKKTVNIYWAMLWSIFPDILAFGIPAGFAFLAAIFSGHFSLITFLTNHNIFGKFISWSPQLYSIGHSIFTWFIVFGLVWLIFRKPKIVMFGWLFHIVLDVFSHALKHYPTPFLYPISDYHFPYGIWWRDPRFMIVNYILLLIVGIFVFVKYRKPKKIKNVIQ